MTNTDLKCPKCKAGKFELSVKKDEAVGVARCVGCSRDYLLLDSEDYWFDVIQTNYPRVTRCSCLSTVFCVEARYDFRDDGDVRRVTLKGLCALCGKEKRLYHIDIDYSPTKSLVEQPLVPCFQPKLLYDLRQYSLYATPADIAEVARYLSEELNCVFFGQFREKANWVCRPLDVAELKAAILATDGRGPGSYSHVYASTHPLNIEPSAIQNAKDEAVYWKRHEVIRLSAPTGMRIGNQPGLLYYLSFANEAVTKNLVTPKSAEFRKLTSILTDWLKSRFVSWRGKDHFDNPDEHLRIFGEEFRGRTKK